MAEKNREREKNIRTEEDYFEETAAEVAPRMGTTAGDAGITGDDDSRRTNNETRAIDADDYIEPVSEGRGMGWTALILAILSLFLMPVLLGAAGLIVGFIARRRGARTLGSWAIGISAVSLIIGLFIAPFFLY
jgi:hypothetical protein